MLTRNALWKQRELITLLRNPQEDSERGPLSVVMETDAGSLSGEFPISPLSSLFVLCHYQTTQYVVIEVQNTIQPL